MLRKIKESLHPGRVLKEDFLDPMLVPLEEFCEEAGVDFEILDEVVKGSRPVDESVAEVLAEELGTSPGLWLKLQKLYDLANSPPHNALKH